MAKDNRSNRTNPPDNGSPPGRGNRRTGENFYKGNGSSFDQNTVEMQEEYISKMKTPVKQDEPSASASERESRTNRAADTSGTYREKPVSDSASSGSSRAADVQEKAQTHKDTWERQESYSSGRREEANYYKGSGSSFGESITEAQKEFEESLRSWEKHESYRASEQGDTFHKDPQAAGSQSSYAPEQYGTHQYEAHQYEAHQYGSGQSGSNQSDWSQPSHAPEQYGSQSSYGSEQYKSPSSYASEQYTSSGITGYGRESGSTQRADRFDRVQQDQNPFRRNDSPSSMQETSTVRHGSSYRSGDKFQPQEGASTVRYSTESNVTRYGASGQKDTQTRFGSGAEGAKTPTFHSSAESGSRPTFNAAVYEAQKDYREQMRRQYSGGQGSDGGSASPKINGFESGQTRYGDHSYSGDGNASGNFSGGTQDRFDPSASQPQTRMERFENTRFQGSSSAFQAPEEHTHHYSPTSETVRFTGDDSNTGTVKYNGVIDQKSDIDVMKMWGPGRITNVMLQGADLMKMGTMVTGYFAYRTALGSSDVGQGMNFAQDTAGTAACLVASNVRASLASSMRKSVDLTVYNKLLEAHFGHDPRIMAEFGITKIHSTKDMETVRRGINKILKEMGYKPVTWTGARYTNLSKIYSIVNKGKLSKEAIALLKVGRNVGMAELMTSNRRFHGRFTSIAQLSRKMFMRYARQTEAGQGAAFTMSVVRGVQRTSRTALQLIHLTAASANLTALAAAKVAAWAAAKVAKTKAGKAAIAGAKKIAPKKAVKTAKKAVKTGKKVTGKITNFTDRIKSFVHDPFGLKSRFKAAAKRQVKRAGAFIMKSPFGMPIRVVSRVLSPFRMLKAMIGKMFAFLGAIVSMIMSVVMIIAFMMAIILLLNIVVSTIVNSIMALFDFTSNEEEIQTAIFEQIAECYEQQNSSINTRRSSYNGTVSVSYVDVKDDEEYELEDHQPEYPFIETTNSAEILSMTMIYFDFEVEDENLDDVLTYVRQLYNGSHLTTVATWSYDVTDEEGNVTATYTNAEITLTTYYFNSIFECSLSGSVGNLEGSTTSEQVWNYFRSLGFTKEATSGILGNLQQESGVDPTAIQNGGAGPAAGIAQWENYSTQSARWANLNAYAQSIGTDWTDLQTQLDFLMQELPSCLSTYGGTSIEAFKALTDIETATTLFETSFERAGTPNMSARITNAYFFYELYANSETDDSSTENNESTENNATETE